MTWGSGVTAEERQAGDRLRVHRHYGPRKRPRPRSCISITTFPARCSAVRYDADFFRRGRANDRLYELLGYSREEFVALGNRMSVAIHPDDLEAVRGKLLAEENRENTIQDEHRLVCRDGRVKWISMKTQVMPGDDGAPYFYGFIVEITEEKLAQERVRGALRKGAGLLCPGGFAGGQHTGTGQRHPGQGGELSVHSRLRHRPDGRYLRAGGPSTGGLSRRCGI